MNPVPPVQAVFLAANTPWVYALAEALAKGESRVAAITAHDWLTFRRVRPRWPDGDLPLNLRRERWVMPPGYVGALAPLFAPLLQAKLRGAARKISPDHAGAPWVVAPYPWFHLGLRGIAPGRLIYYHLDDYPLYHAGRAALISRQQAEMVARSCWTLCLSWQQAELLRARHPEHAGRIRHFPLGVVERFLNPHPETTPTTQTVGYVGNLSDRVDWALVGETARGLPQTEFIFVGELEAPAVGHRPNWVKERQLALALPNVRRVGPVRQDDVPAHYWKFGINWIPYDVAHPFNIAACPTKIMDGLASGRPVVSTDLPECKLYPEWITTARSPAEMIGTIRSLTVEPASPARATAQVGFTRQHTWAQRASSLLETLDTGDRGRPE